MSETPFIETTSNGYEITGPDSDGEICCEVETHLLYGAISGNLLYFTREDLEMMLRRIE